MGIETALGIAAPIIGGAIGGASAPDEITNKAEFPDWLKPYIHTGEAGPNFAAPTPLNYNWMDWAAQLGAGGLPWGGAPPMSMNDPRMTFGNVYTPTAGGPWGYGLGPGPLTAEAGIPGAPGPQFTPPPDGFIPGPTSPVGSSPTSGGGPSFSQGDLAQAQQLMDNWALMGSMGDDFTPMSSLQALQAVQGGSDPMALYQAMARTPGAAPGQVRGVLDLMGGV